MSAVENYVVRNSAQNREAMGGLEGQLPGTCMSCVNRHQMYYFVHNILQVSMCIVYIQFELHPKHDITVVLRKLTVSHNHNNTHCLCCHSDRLLMSDTSLSIILFQLYS